VFEIWVFPASSSTQGQTTKLDQSISNNQARTPKLQPSNPNNQVQTPKLKQPRSLVVRAWVFELGYLSFVV
jgi:hypothetical protein